MWKVLALCLCVCLCVLDMWTITAAVCTALPLSLDLCVCFPSCVTHKHVCMVSVCVFGVTGTRLMRL